MELSVIQCVILALFSMSTSVIGALGTTYAWYTLSRPLVASLVVGLVMGDVSTAIIVGSAIQVVYIALVTPGGTVSADLDAVCWIGIPLAIAAGYGLEASEAALLGVPIAAAVGTVGTVFFYGTAVANLVWQETAWKLFDKGNYKGMWRATFLLPLISHFAIRFIPTFLILRYGLPYVANIKETIPMDSLLMKTLFTVGSLLPAVGIAILLKMVIKEPIDLVIFGFGFILSKILGINLVGATIVGGFVAYLKYQLSMRILDVKGAAVVTEEDEF